jgi:hypothetical protein
MQTTNTQRPLHPAVRRAAASLLCISLLSAACSAPGISEAPAAIAPTSSADNATPMTTTVTTLQAQPDDSATLSWQGTIDDACYTLTVEDDAATATATANATVARCGEAARQTAVLHNTSEWESVQAHFGEVTAETAAGAIRFEGQGRATGDAWAEALATWARFTAMETASGRTSASARTTLAWSLGELDGQADDCAQLVLLAYGYGYAMVVPCAGGPATIAGQGWLTDAELATLQGWVATGRRVETEAGYVDAQGTTPLGADEVAAWSQLVYDRLAAGN